MNEQLQKKADQIFQLTDENPELYARLASAATADELAAICREQGIELSGAEAAKGFDMLLEVMAEGQSRVLSDAELERVAAGASTKTGGGGGSGNY